ncbi:acetyltransferase [Kaistia sp. 32K]|uniref:GNAT family N-acetyltransferase n=1 Tax=Kaistia sp. 32K TaxID=2795690 RepID=UPI00191697BB|nr:GNAT family N-acetyltransferase [Kaistia sp. 32K]BCP55116.1 acetyltransferase [Kaistia sp. 32K]
MPTTLAIEAACLSAWPALSTVHDGAWVWRFAHGYSKRANSFQSLDLADDGDAERRIAYLAALSSRNGIEPVFRVTPLAGPGILEALDRKGWAPFEESRVLAMDLDGHDFARTGDVRFFNPTDPRWFRAQTALSAASAKTVEILKTLLGLIAPEARGIVAYAPDGTPAAAALAVNAGGIGVFLNVVTDKTKRRQGYGAAVMRAALGWTVENGARYAAIQVTTENEPAIRLYEGLGFVEQYRYHYRRPA